MSVRLYDPSDAPALDRLLDSNRGHDVRLDHDRIIVSRGVSGALVWRPTAVIHELILPRTLGTLAVARDLVSFACEDAAYRKFAIQIASFMIDSSNRAMIRYVRDLGAVEESRQLWSIPLKVAYERVANYYASPGLHW